MATSSSISYHRTPLPLECPTGPHMAFVLTGPNLLFSDSPPPNAQLAQQGTNSLPHNFSMSIVCPVANESTPAPMIALIAMNMIFSSSNVMEHLFADEFVMKDGRHQRAFTLWSFTGGAFYAMTIQAPNIPKTLEEAWLAAQKSCDIWMHSHHHFKSDCFLEMDRARILQRISIRVDAQVVRNPTFPVLKRSAQTQQQPSTTLPAFQQGQPGALPPGLRINLARLGIQRLPAPQRDTDLMEIDSGTSQMEID